MKHSKAEQKKIANRFVSKYKEFYEMSSEDLVILKEKKMSSTDRLAYEQAVNQKMKEEILNQKLKDNEEIKEGEVTEQDNTSEIKEIS